MARKYPTAYLLSKAQATEEEGAGAAAAKLYHQVVKQDPVEARAYNRLMVYYRRQKNYRKEQEVIRQAIAGYQRHAEESQQNWLRTHQRTARLAKALVKSLGLVNRKGLASWESRQVAAWRKRLQVVKKRLQRAA